MFRGLRKELLGGHLPHFCDVFLRVFSELRHAVVAAELDGLAFEDDADWIAHGAEFLAGDEAGFERIGLGVHGGLHWWSGAFGGYSFLFRAGDKE